MSSVQDGEMKHLEDNYTVSPSIQGTLLSPGCLGYVKLIKKCWQSFTKSL